MFAGLCLLYKGPHYPAEADPVRGCYPLLLSAAVLIIGGRARMIVFYERLRPSR